ncbi:MAG TPA: NUDIX domain-containing protein [Oryzihumus sp.]|nr:NUDIX domain-containing protein [Oryzihumus sp.]
MAADEPLALYDPQHPTGRVTGSAPRSRVRAENLPHAATAVLVRRPDGAVYVHRRTDTKDVFPGMHDAFAGGCVDAGEDPGDAARRELAEELGISGVPLVPRFRHWYRDDHTHYLAFGYEVTWDGPVVHQPEEVADGWWMPWEELLTRLGDPAWPFVPDGRAGIEWLLEAREGRP